MRIVVVAALVALGSVVAVAQDTVALPGGATALNETHGDWIVHCEVVQQQIGCALQQEQADGNSKQRILLVELAPQEGALRGTLVLPFGLALERGVTLQIEGAAPMPGLRFRTCLPAGCLVDVSFDAPTVAAMAQASALKVNTIADNGAEAPFSISLKGFSSALDRTITLAK
jgi:invasion protein IalB